MKPWLDSKGSYFMITLCKEGSCDKMYIHRLVAKTFISNPYNLPEVNHKDHDSYNNKVENLEWCTRKQNMKHCFELHSQVRNYKECYLYKDTERIGDFQSINSACRYAKNTYGVSYSSLNKYKKVNEFKILPKI